MSRELHPAPLSLFWYWMDERHRIYLKRAAGESKPWTEDLILRDYKFTNVFRRLDRGTVWLTENFLKPHAGDPLEDIAFNICWYRMFNWWGTGERIGWQTKWDADYIKQDLRDCLASGKQVFTGAHMLRSADGRPKIDSIVDVCAELFQRRQQVVNACRVTQSLEKTFDKLIQVDYVGGFLAYEMVTDMRHTRLLNDATDIYTWANPGPGAIRGLRRLGMPYKPRNMAIESIRDLQGRLQLALDIPFGNNDPVTALRGCQIEMRDIEHSLCEFDKYCRVKFGEGRPRSRYNGSV